MMLVLGSLALRAPFRAPLKSPLSPYGSLQARITLLFNSLLRYVQTGYVLKENKKNYRKITIFGFFGFLVIRAVFETSWWCSTGPLKAQDPPKVGYTSQHLI